MTVFDFAKRDFVAITVIASIIIVVIYRFMAPPITQFLFGVSVQRDITLDYGFVDIATIVLLAAFLALFIAAVIAFSRWLARRIMSLKAYIHERQLASLTPSEKDEAIHAIEKILNNRTPINTLEVVKYTPTGGTAWSYAFKLPAAVTHDDKIWIAPPAQLAWASDAGAAHSADFRRLFNSDNFNDALDLGKKLKEWQDKREANLVWQVYENVSLRGPKLIATSEQMPAPNTGEQFIVEKK